ncbi:hypothetical protein HMPREF1585_00703 [Gardnerella vaginalis JCP8481B]|nr:hypothetical protein HMPREF1585_00703 [Gardnerella vaginalis JCP8481B]
MRFVQFLHCMRLVTLLYICMFCKFACICAVIFADYCARLQVCVLLAFNHIRRIYTS